MSDKELANALRKYGESKKLSHTRQEILKQSANAMERLSAELKLCRNELCLKCGEYKNRHKGACDGCRWLEKPE